MKLILPLSSLIHCHIIRSVHMTAYLMLMKSPLRLASRELLRSGYNYSEHCADFLR
jgi:hypothetical protein